MWAFTQVIDFYIMSEKKKTFAETRNLWVKMFVHFNKKLTHYTPTETFFYIYNCSHRGQTDMQTVPAYGPCCILIRTISSLWWVHTPNQDDVTRQSFWYLKSTTCCFHFYFNYLFIFYHFGSQHVTLHTHKPRWISSPSATRRNSGPFDMEF